MEGTNFGAGKDILVYGDTEPYWVRRSTLTLNQSEHVEFKEWNIFLRCGMYVDGKLTQRGVTGSVGPMVLAGVKS